jgi:uncharacterized protein (TIGR03000 family)
MAALPAAVDASIQLAVEVPSGAKLFVNDRATTSSGATRQFVSRDLERGRKYEFRVRAEVIDKNGKLISETQQFSMAAGEVKTLKFKFANQPLNLAVASRANTASQQF